MPWSGVGRDEHPACSSAIVITDTADSSGSRDAINRPPDSQQDDLVEQEQNTALTYCREPAARRRGVVAELGELGVATVHEAAGKTGLLGTSSAGLGRCPRRRDRPYGSCGPGDNLMVHAAVEQARPGIC